MRQFILHLFGLAEVFLATVTIQRSDAVVTIYYRYNLQTDDVVSFYLKSVDNLVPVYTMPIEFEKGIKKCRFGLGLPSTRFSCRLVKRQSL